MKNRTYIVFTFIVSLVFMLGCEQVSVNPATETQKQMVADVTAAKAVHAEWVLAYSKVEEEQAISKVQQRFFKNTSPYLRGEKAVNKASLLKLHHVAQQLIAELEGRPAQVGAKQLIGQAMLMWVMPQAEEKVPTDLTLFYVDMLTSSMSLQFEAIAATLEQVEGHREVVAALAEANLINLQAHVEIEQDLRKRVNKYAAEKGSAGKAYPDGLSAWTQDVDAWRVRFEALAN